MAGHRPPVRRGSRTGHRYEPARDRGTRSDGAGHRSPAPTGVMERPRQARGIMLTVKLRLAAVFDAQPGGFATGWSPVSWGSIDELFDNLTMPLDAPPERPVGSAAAVLGSRHRDRPDPATPRPSPAAPGRRVPARPVRAETSRPLRPRRDDALPAPSAWEAPSATGPDRRGPPSRARQPGAVERRSRGVGRRETRGPPPTELAKALPSRRSVRRDPCSHADRGDG